MSSQKKKSHAQRVLELLIQSFPTVQDFNDLEYIVAQHPSLMSLRGAFTDDDAEEQIALQQNLKWIREELYS